MNKRHTTSSVIDALLQRRTTIFKTIGKRGATYAFSDNLEPIHRDVIEKMLARKDIVDLGDAEQTLALNERWVTA